jgi:hypothetical protein
MHGILCKKPKRFIRKAFSKRVMLDLGRGLLKKLPLLRRDEVAANCKALAPNLLLPLNGIGATFSKPHAQDRASRGCAVMINFDALINLQLRLFACKL